VAEPAGAAGHHNHHSGGGDGAVPQERGVIICLPADKEAKGRQNEITFRSS
jgi:hypothetical protein